MSQKRDNYFDSDTLYLGEHNPSPLISMNRTIVIVGILFILGGIQAIHAFIPADIYALINVVLGGIETFLQIPVAVAAAKARKQV